MDREAIHFIPHLSPLFFFEHQVIIILTINGQDYLSVFREKMTRAGSAIAQGRVAEAVDQWMQKIDL
jgi:hypothetical protein